MFYAYKCEEGHITDLIMSMEDEKPKVTICETCGKESNRMWGSSVVIPDYMRAIPTDGSAGTYAEFSNLNNTFKHASRPSGRTEKVYH